jgi:predicted site-specific integrase-resolvase
MEALGNISVSAESLGVVRNTLVKWVEEEELKDVVVQARNARLDFAESKLDQNINNGDTTAIIFFA